MLRKNPENSQDRPKQIRLEYAYASQFTYADWLDYFKKNDRQRLEISFAGDILTAREQKIIFPSVCYFQRGERSNGMHLLNAADCFARSSSQAVYKDCIRYFVKEENVHSAYLKTYMEHYHVHEKNVVILDSIFRYLRKLFGLRCEVMVLVTAEMIALSYYDALMHASGSKALKSICQQMLQDETAHILFQSYTLSYFPKSIWMDFFRIILMEAASAAVWAACHKVFLAGGWTLKRFLRANLGCLKRSIALSNAVSVS